MAAGFVGFGEVFAFVGVHLLPGAGVGGLGSAALGAAVGEAGFVGLSSNSSSQTEQILIGKAMASLSYRNCAVRVVKHVWAVRPDRLLLVRVLARHPTSQTVH